VDEFGGRARAIGWRRGRWRLPPEFGKRCRYGAGFQIGAADFPTMSVPL
jgi:hypothetical protein